MHDGNSGQSKTLVKARLLLKSRWKNLRLPLLFTQTGWRHEVVRAAPCAPVQGRCNDGHGENWQVTPLTKSRRPRLIDWGEKEYEGRDQQDPCREGGVGEKNYKTASIVDEPATRRWEVRLSRIIQSTSKTRPGTTCAIWWSSKSPTTREKRQSPKRLSP